MKKTFADFEIRANPSSGDLTLVSPVDAVGEIKVASLGSIVDAMIGEHWRGEWSETEIYYKYDVVRYNGQLYFAEVVNTGLLPHVNPEWSLIASRGEQGIRGLQGGLGQSDTLTVTTPFTAPNAVADMVVVLPQLFCVFKLESATPVRVRLYYSEAQRLNDLLRSPTTPVKGDHGCFFDAQVKAAVRVMTPPAVCSSTGTGYLSVTNMGNTTEEITLTINYLALESI